MVSLDDGDTWDVSDFILVADYDGTITLNEPNIEQFGDTLIIVLRDDDDDYKATWTKSTDGGATWTALATSTEYYNIGGRHST